MTENNPLNESIKERLRSLGLQLGTETLKEKVPSRKYPIEQVFPQGEDEFNEFGHTFIIHNLYEENHLHGNIPLNYRPDLSMLGKWAGAEEDDYDLEKFIFIDTETSGLSGGAGTIIFLIGAGYFEKEIFHLKQFFLRVPEDEPAFLDSFSRFFARFEYIVSYNGKSFDLPIIRNRFILNRFPFQYEDLLHFDLLQFARKIWRYRLSSRKLSDMEEHILQVQRTEEEVPGWLVPQFYFDYLKSGDARPLEGVVYHNEIDILSLAALFLHGAGLLSSPEIHPFLDMSDLYGIGRIYEELGLLNECHSTYQECLKNGLPEDLLIETLQRKALLYKRKDEWKKAIILWEEAANLEDIESMIELAKYFEHQEKDYISARAWTQKALLILQELNSNAANAVYLEELLHRHKRIEAKRTKADNNQEDNNGK